VYSGQILNAVNDGLISTDDVDKAFGHLTTIQMQLGLFDANKAEQPYFNLGANDIDTPAHRALALEAAHQTITLLKNEGNLLPLSSGKGLRIAVRR
jgi:beta-glucosidase